MWFFVAVLMVIAATYLIFIAGSVLMCRLLQKNKKYYYKAEHFISVSSMIHRMKRNGAGLASICILATMVLVMIAFTSSLVIGLDDNIKSMYPYDVNITAEYSLDNGLRDEDFAGFGGKVTSLLNDKKTVPSEFVTKRYRYSRGLGWRQYFGGRLSGSFEEPFRFFRETPERKRYSLREYAGILQPLGSPDKNSYRFYEADFAERELRACFTSFV